MPKTLIRQWIENLEEIALSPLDFELYEVYAKQVMPRDIMYGDNIVTKWQGGRPIKSFEAKHIEHFACSKRDTHINGGCYSHHIPIWVIK